MTTDFIAVNIEDGRWAGVGAESGSGVEIEALAAVACGQTLKYFKYQPPHFEISLLACDDTRIARLNHEFRTTAGPTNVLSWPETDRSPPRGTHPVPIKVDLRKGPIALGDIAIAYDTCAREAGAAGIEMRDHTSHLLVHATLHLLGYDHIHDLDATLMQQIEAEILGNLGISDPYRGQGA